MGSGKRKIEIKKITKEPSRTVTFTKRRTGLFKKARELQKRTGANVAIVVFSPAGKPYAQGDAGLINAALEAWSGSCSKDNGASSSNGGDGEVVGCGSLLLCGGYDGAFGGASSSAPAAVDAVVSNADMMGCNGVDLSCYGGFEIATSSSVGMIGCNGVDAVCYGGLERATSADMMGCNGVNVGCYGGFEGITSSGGCATEEALNACWDLFPVEAYSDFEVEAYTLYLKQKIARDQTKKDGRVLG